MVIITESEPIDQCGLMTEGQGIAHEAEHTFIISGCVCDGNVPYLRTATITNYRVG